MNTPLVTIVCLCYNQERFVEEAIRSVLQQTYSNIQLIVVDDASTDGSVQRIEQAINLNPDVRLIVHPKNMGNCRAFNSALPFVRGHYMIDLAADDVLLPSRVEEGVQMLEAKGQSYGLQFSDAEWVSENGVHLFYHSDKYPHSTIPEGNIYRHIIDRYFICPPTVMFRTEVIRQLGGYDETLAYEDFDFWIRSSRRFNFCYAQKVLVRKRVVHNSLGSQQFKRRSIQLFSTFRVCEKILELNENEEEQKALTSRILYEMRVALRLLSFHLFFLYGRLLIKNVRRRFA